MSNDDIQELICAFLDERGGYVAGASEKELFDLLATVRERCAQIAEATTRQPMDYIDWPPVPAAADDRARQIAAAIRAS